LRPKASATENLAAMPNESHPQAQCSIASGFFQFLGDGVCCLLDGLGCFGLIGHSRLRSVLVYHINWRLFSGLGRCAALPSGCGSVGGNQLVGFVHVISEIVNCEEPAHQHQDARSGASCHIHDLLIAVGRLQLVPGESASELQLAGVRVAVERLPCAPL